MEHARALPRDGGFLSRVTWENFKVLNFKVFSQIVLN
jgi:hypothetical protein